MNGPYKQNVADWITVRLETAAGADLTAIAFNDAALSFIVQKPGVAGVAKAALAAGDWKEGGKGFYQVKLTAGDLDTVGQGSLITTYGTISIDTPFRVTAALLDDVNTIVAALRADYTTARAAKLDQLDAAVTTRAPAATAVSSVDYTPGRAALLTRLDADVSSRLAAVGYTAPDNASIALALAAALNAMRAALGLFVVIRDVTYSPTTPDLVTVKVRFYDTKAHHDADDGVTGLVVPEFTRTISYTAVELAGTNHQMSKAVGS